MRVLVIYIETGKENEPYRKSRKSEITLHLTIKLNQTIKTKTMKFAL